MSPRGAAAAALLVVALSGCAPGYVLRAAFEEARILWRRQPIEKVLQGDVDAETRRKLELTLAARDFARDRLGLAVGGSYSSLSRVDEAQIVHIVSAAPRDRLVPYTWWFPIVGRVPYRAYFAEPDARRLARRLERDGYDTYVRPGIAFSTLGWFDDPLLSNLLRYDDVHLVETILHELLHSTVYLSGQGAFNESFANFVGHRGAQAFFAERGDAERAAQAEAQWEDACRLSSFLGDIVEELNAAYAGGVEPGDREILFDSVRARSAELDWRTNAYRGFADGPLNNAILVARALYFDQLDLFERAWVENGESLRATIDWVIERARGADEPFTALRAALPGRPAAQTSMRSSRRIP